MAESEQLGALSGLDVSEGEKPALMREIARHRELLQRSLGRDVGMVVAAADYLTNVRRRLRKLRLIEAEQLRAIEEHAATDELTGLYNRRSFERVLAREVERSRRYGVNASLLLLDLDGFKTLNDTHGHAAGDRVLRYAAAMMCRHLRATDVPCRVGGDEFAIVLCDTPLTDALAVAERIRADVEDAFARAAITVSAGVASVPMHAATAEKLLAKADHALYTAKGAGRNVAAAAPPG
jgi:diguanylate cyclase (GGDEF)-like protein